MTTNLSYNTSKKFEIMTGEEFLKYKKYWPVTYIMRDRTGKRVYIGITKDFESRMKQHDADPKMKGMDYRSVVYHMESNESLTYYLESFLIHFGRMNDGIRNINSKIQNGELYKKNHFYSSEVAVNDSKEIYNELVKRNIFWKSIDELKKHEFQKLNPDLGFTKKQESIIENSLKLINKSETFYIYGPAGTGKTAILIKIINDYSTEEYKNKERVLGIYSASQQNRKVIEKYVKLINDSKIIFFKTLNDLSRSIKCGEVNKNNLHLLIDEAQSLTSSKYNKKQIHVVCNEDSELDWIMNNSSSHTLLFDYDQTDYSSDIDIRNKLDNKNKILELDEQFRIKADVKIFNFFKEMLGMAKETKKTFDTYEYDIKIFDTPEEAVNEIKLINETHVDGKSKILIGYDDFQIKSLRKYQNLFFDSKDKNRDIMSLPIEKMQNSKRTKGLSLDNTLVIIGKTLRWENNQVVVDTRWWKSNVIQSKSSEEEKIKLIKNTFYIMMTRASRNLVLYIEDESLRNKIREMVKTRLIKRPFHSMDFKRSILDE